MKKGFQVTLALVVPVALAIAGFAAAGGGQSSFAEVRDATAAYHDIAVARANHNAVELPQVQPYGEGTCIANLDGPGAMGIHLLLQDRLDDKLIATEPEVLLYEKRNDGTYKLTGVEYVVAGESQPELFGQALAPTNLGRYGSPNVDVWTLHAWIWKPNPAGILKAWNTRVTC